MFKKIRQFFCSHDWEAHYVEMPDFEDGAGTHTHMGRVWICSKCLKESKVRHKHKVRKL